MKNVLYSQLSSSEQFSVTAIGGRGTWNLPGSHPKWTTPLLPFFGPIDISDPADGGTYLLPDPFAFLSQMDGDIVVSLLTELRWRHPDAASDMSAPDSERQLCPDVEWSLCPGV